MVWLIVYLAITLFNILLTLILWHDLQKVASQYDLKVNPNPWTILFSFIPIGNLIWAFILYFRYDAIIEDAKRCYEKFSQ